MTAKSNTFENDLLALIFQGTAIANLAQNGTSPLTNLYLALHTADPGEAGDQTTNEVTTGAYTGYARKSVARSSAGFTLGTGQVTLAAAQDFPTMSGGTGGTITHFSVGTAASGAGKILYKGTVSPNIVLGTNVTPSLGTGTVISED